MRSRSAPDPWKPAAYSTAVLIVASVVPSPLERRSEWERVGPDKLLHFIGHAGHSVTLANALGAERYTDREAAILAVALSTTLSFVSGRLQRWVPGRAFEYEDVLAGLIGSILGVSWWYVTTDSEGDRGTTGDSSTR